MTTLSPSMYLVDMDGQIGIGDTVTISEQLNDRTLTGTVVSCEARPATDGFQLRVERLADEQSEGGRFRSPLNLWELACV